jgi:hypothetical protein
VLPLLLKKVRNCAAAAMRASQQFSEKQKHFYRRGAKSAEEKLEYAIFKVHEIRVAWFQIFRLNTRLK